VVGNLRAGIPLYRRARPESAGSAFYLLQMSEFPPEKLGALSCGSGVRFCSCPIARTTDQGLLGSRTCAGARRLKNQAFMGDGGIVGNLPECGDGHFTYGRAAVLHPRISSARDGITGGSRP